MKSRILLGSAAALAFIGIAGAQVNTVPQLGLITEVLKKSSYSSVISGLAAASAATDIACISGSSSKAISVKSISVSGTAGTLISVPVFFNHHVSLDTGTATTASTISHNSSNPTATAAVVSYTANPTIVDPTPISARGAVLSLPTTAANIAPAPLIFSAGTGALDLFIQGFDIPSGGTAQQWCLNLNATTPLTTLINISIDWTEQ